jgi:hypothetical protein
MKSTKQETINTILSFSYEELANWIQSRLQGEDDYFSIYLGHELNLSGFLTDAFHHIKNKKFRVNFLEILGDLVKQLKKYNPKEIEENKEYIYELLCLCSGIKQFEDQVTLIELAESARFKKTRVYDTDLHLALLTTLSSYRIGGNYRFWIKQMQDESNKYYANAAFYAFLNNRYSLNILFKHIGILIDRFKGQFELVLAVESLFDDYEPKKIYSMFNKIESRLSHEQKEAVNNAFKEAGYDPVYETHAAVEKELKYIPAPPQLEYVRAPTPEYDPLAALKESSAEIFKLMGFEVEINREISDRVIDLFAQRKKNFIPLYECWICKCDTTNRKVNKKTVDDFSTLWEPVKKELQKQTNDDCYPMIISGKGFTKTAIEAAKIQNIFLKTYNQLLSDLNTFYSLQKPLIRDLDALISHKKPGE